jgi:hypothetical protein
VSEDKTKIKPKRTKKNKNKQNKKYPKKQTNEQKATDKLVNIFKHAIIFGKLTQRINRQLRKA